ncbi:potassium channel protein [Bacillus vallismortis]|uniref:potassium channel family protein n=1 Tax=Bacillus TaxID=1386 RepID=UPI00057C140D|nr:MULTISPECIES: potassium channel family protein [Bacillus]PJZ01906.1 potassium channel protein [Bacillus vallismortis]
MKSNRIFISWLRWPLFIRIAVIILFLILLFGQIIYILEPKQFTSVFEGIWWAIVTVSTVGYGDYVPHTPMGQAAGILLILTGASFVTAYFATLSAAAFSRQHRYIEGKVAYKGRGHIILIGWNEKTNRLLKQLQLAAPSKTVVLIDETLNEGPLIENVHFIRGHAADDETLKRANITEAESVMVTADQYKSETEADMLSVLILLSVKGLNPLAFCIVEILTDRFVTNAERAGANQIIGTSEFISQAMLQHYQANVQPSKSGINLKIDQQVKLLPVPDDLKGAAYKTCVLYFLDHNTTIIGVQKEEGPVISPPLTYKVLETDKFLAI